MVKSSSFLLPSFLGLLLAFAAPLGAEPRIRSFGVKNAASYALAERGGIAPGSMFVVQGIGLGPEQLVQAAPPYPSRLPEDAPGTEITVTSAADGLPRTAWLVYSWNWQLAAILPSDIPLGPADLTVAYAGETSLPHRIQIVPRAPGLFTTSMTGAGPAVAQIFHSPDEQPLNGLARPVLPGQWLILWATGLGPISAPDNEPPPIGTVDPDLVVEIGSLRLKPSYAGRAPGYPGLDQINVWIPPDAELPDDCYTPVRLRTGEFVSREAAVTTGNAPGACSHPLGLSPDVLARLDAGGRASIAAISLTASRLETPPNGAAGGAPSGVRPSVFGWLYSLTAPYLFFVPSPAQSGEPGCTLTQGGTIARISDDIPPPPPASPFRGVDAGDALSLAGPGGRTLELTKAEDFADTGLYRHDPLPEDFLAPGSWTVTAPGGPDAGPFSAKTRFPGLPPIELPAEIDRAQDLLLTWSPAGYAPEDFFTVAVSSAHSPPDDPDTRIFTSVRCGVPASAGALTIPASLLSQLPGTESAQIRVTHAPVPAQIAPITATGIDAGWFTFSALETRMVEMR